VKIFILSLITISSALACPSNHACRKMLINIDLSSHLEVGEVVPIELCQQSQNCERTEEFVSSDTENNCSVRFEFENSAGEITPVYARSEEMHEYITQRFQAKNWVNVYDDLSTGVYTIRRQALVDDVHICVPIEEDDFKKVKVSYDQRPEHCLNGYNKDGTPSGFVVNNVFVERSSVCKREQITVYDPSLEGTVCGNTKKELRSRFNTQVRATAEDIADQLINNPKNISADVEGLVQQYATNMAVNASHLIAHGIALVTALQIHDELNQNLKAPCATNVCIDCSVNNN
tara:strand:+ start:324782 stop:325648 length:867 start_codon:yes stop_codon:yes gene_type:complete